MTLTQLKYVVALDVHRSFRRAAAACHVAQPSLSIQVRKLEEELGGKLFDRSKNEIRPTPLGLQVIEQAGVVLAEAGRIPLLVQAEVGTLTGALRLGMLPTVAPYVLPTLLAHLYRTRPQVELRFVEGTTAHLLDHLRQDRLDAALLSTPVPSRGLAVRLLYAEPLVGFLSKGHPLREKERLDLQDLTAADLWLPSAEHPLRAQILALLGPGAEEPPPRFECDTLETIKRIVEQHQGMAVLPALAVQGAPPGFVRPISSLPTRTLRLVYPRTFLNAELLDVLAEAIQTAVSTRRRRAVPVQVLN